MSKLFTCCTHGNSLCHSHSYSQEQVQDTTDGHQGHLPQWHSEGEGLHETTRGVQQWHLANL
jgi:hypothetical protein